MTNLPSDPPQGPSSEDAPQTPGPTPPSGEAHPDADSPQYPPGPQHATGQQYGSGPQYPPEPQHAPGQQYPPGPPYGAGPQYPPGQPYGYPGQPGYQPGYGPGYQPTPMSPYDERLWATLTHLSGLFFSLFAPLVVWLVVKDRGAFVEDQTKEALNFQITVAIFGAAITLITVVTLGIGAILYLLAIPAVVFMILAAVAANRGEWYRYPVNIRLVH
jgi:uncharacterized protein